MLADMKRTTKGRNYLIVDCEIHHPFTQGGALQWFYNLLDQSNDKWMIRYPRQGDWPSEKDLDQSDVMIIPGNRASPFEKEPWIKRLSALILTYSRKEAKKILGICFGHQLIAQTFGGYVNRSICGYEIGIKTISPTTILKPILKQLGLPLEFNVYESHQDQVFELPPCSYLLASSPRCPIESFSIHSNILCFQGHPELPLHHLQELMTMRRDQGLISDDLYNYESNKLTQMKPDTLTFRSLILHWIHSSDWCHRFF